MTQPPAEQPPSRFEREWKDLRQEIGFWHVVGGLLMLVSAGITLYLAVKGQSNKGGDPVTLAILAILAQAGAAAMFAYSRKFDPRYAQSALAHLTTLARRAGDAVQSTQDIIEEHDPNPAVVLERLRVANVEFSYMREWAVDAADDWLRVLNAPLKRPDGDQPPTNQGQNQIGISG